MEKSSLAQRIEEAFDVSDARIIHDGNNVVASAKWSHDELPGLERILIKLSNYKSGRKDPYYEIASMGDISKESELPDGTAYSFRIPRPIIADSNKTWLNNNVRTNQPFTNSAAVRKLGFDTILVMEELQGRSLNHVVPGKLTPSQIAQIAEDVYAPLVISHHRNIVHRDVKPSNIIGTIEDGHIRATLVDYGAEERFDRAKDSIAAKRFVGTPGYMASWLDELDTQNRYVAKTLDYIGLATTLSYLALGKVLPFDQDDKSYPSQKMEELKALWDDYVENAEGHEKQAAQTLRDFAYACFDGPNPSIAVDENAYQTWLPKFQEVAQRATAVSFTLDYAQGMNYQDPGTNCPEDQKPSEQILPVTANPLACITTYQRPDIDLHALTIHYEPGTVGDLVPKEPNLTVQDSPSVPNTVADEPGIVFDEICSGKNLSRTIPDGHCEE